MRALPALLALTLLSGCGQGGADEAFVDSRLPPALEERFYPPKTWAWGLIQIGQAPAIRYGVAAPEGRPRGDLLIATGYGESAEAWYETANTLVGKGYVVWIMEAPGQGGSARATRPRDLGHDQDPAVHAAALAAMVAVIARPAVLVAQSTAAPAALIALSRGLPVRQAILSAPAFASADPPILAGPAVVGAAGMTRARLGWLRAVGQQPWRRSDPLPRGRAGVIAKWQAANPDLRMGGVSYGWIEGFDRQTGLLTPQRLSRIAAPVLMLEAAAGSRRGAAVCTSVKSCVRQTIPGGRSSLHLEADAVYAPWAAAIDRTMARAFAPSD